MYTKNLIPSASKRGFTLVELMITMGLFTMLITVVLTIYAQLIQQGVSLSATESIDQEAQRIIARFAYDLRQSREIVYPQTLNIPESRLELSQADSSFEYSVTGTTLKIGPLAQTMSFSSSDINLNNASFTRLGNGTTQDTVQFNFTLTKNSSQISQAVSKQYRTTIAIR